MDDKKLESYEQEVDDSTVSNPFSNALKNILQKLHLIKSDQKLIGDRETNSRGYQITTKDPLAATDKNSLKAILRTAFETHQQKRAEKMRAKNATNTMPKYTIGKQDQSIEQNQVVSKDPTIEVIRPITVSEKATIKSQNMHSAPTVESISIDEAVVEDINKAKPEEGTFESDASNDTALIEIDLEQDVVQNVTPVNTMTTGNIVTGEAEHDDDKKPKHTVRKKSEAGNRELEL